MQAFISSVAIGKLPLLGAAVYILLVGAAYWVHVRYSRLILQALFFL